MTQRYSLPRAPSLPSPSLAQRLRAYLLGSLQGRILLGALSLFVLGQAGAPLPDWLGVLVALLLVFFGVLHGPGLARSPLRRMLARILTKLIVSYLFIAVVPVVLLALFFMIAGMLSLTLVASYMVGSQLERTAQQLQAIAHAAAIGLDSPAERLQELLERRLQPARALHPNLAYAYGRDGGVLAAAGQAPRRLPAWLLARKEFAGLVHEKDKPEVVRAAWSDGRSFLVLEVPLDEALTAAMEKRTGIQVVPGLRLAAQVDGRGMRIRETGEERGQLKQRLQE